MYIDGQWVEALEGRYFDTHNPTTQEVIAKIPEGSREDARRAIKSARKALTTISSMSVWERSKLLQSIVSVLESKKEELARTLSIDQGKPYYSEALGEIGATINCFVAAAEQIKYLETPVFPVEDKNKRVLSILQPKGVYAVITPWNFPFMIPAEYLAPGLAAGNSIVWVPAPTTSVCAIKLMECLEEAGVPEGVVNLVTGVGSVVGDEIVSNPGTDAVGFTGSTVTGNKIASRAAGKPLLLEMGGNGPTIVLRDADLDKAAHSIAGGCFFNAGQVCSATERLLVHRDVHDELVEKLVNYAKEVRLGDPLDKNTTMGPLNNEKVAEKNKLHAEDSVNKGAKILIGGSNPSNLGSSLFFEPTVIVDVTEDCLYHSEETFGPVAPVMSFETNEEVLAIADNNPWGLVSSVFTNNINEALFFAEKLRSGSVIINDNSNYWEVHLPFGGASGKASGIGKIGGKYSIQEMSDLKTIAIDIS